MAEGPVADLLATAMLAVSAFCAGRLVLGALWRRTAERDVDVVHLLMGISMAGMLTDRLTGAWNDAWLVVFAASSTWFAWGALRAVQAAQPGAPWWSGGSHGNHLVASATMLYMLVAMRWSPMGGAGMRAMAPAGSGVVLPAMLATLVVADAVLAAARGLRPDGAAAPAGSAAPAVDAPSPLATTIDRAPALAPRATSICLVVMSVAMAYMLVTVRP